MLQDAHKMLHDADWLERLFLLPASFLLSCLLCVVLGDAGRPSFPRLLPPTPAFGRASLLHLVLSAVCCAHRYMDEYDGASYEALVDLLVAVYDECNTPTLKKEKAIADFIASCKSAMCCWFLSFDGICLTDAADPFAQSRARWHKSGARG